MMEDSCGHVMTTAHAAGGAFRSSAHAAAEKFRSSAPELLSKTCGGGGDEIGSDSGRFGVGLGFGAGKRVNVNGIGVDIPPLSCAGLGLDCHPDGDDEDESDTESNGRKNYKKNGRGGQHLRRSSNGRGDGKGRDKGSGGSNNNSNRRSSMRSLTTTQLQQKINPGTRRDLLRDRVEVFRAKGWLTQQEHRKYLAFISSFETTVTRASAIGGDSDEDDGTHGLKELEVELDLLERRWANKSIWNKILTPTAGMMNPASATNGSKVAIATTPSAFKNNSNVLSSSTNRFLNQQQKGQQTATSKDDHYKAQLEQVELSRKTIVRPNQLERIMNEHLVSELFVDTSFFARLVRKNETCHESPSLKKTLLLVVVFALLFLSYFAFLFLLSILFYPILSSSNS